MRKFFLLLFLESTSLDRNVQVEAFITKENVRASLNVPVTIKNLLGANRFSVVLTAV